MEEFKNLFDLSREKPFTQVNRKTDTQWDYAIANDTLILRFEETISPEDWVSNFDILKTPYRDMEKTFRVHRGFINKYKSIRDEIQLLLTDPSTPIKNVKIYGYSQGGALALLAHEDVWYNHEHLRTKIETVTFGCPRVFGWGAPKERWQGVTQVENGNDVVTKVPFRLLGFKHVSKRVHIGKKRRWWLFSVRDHFPKSYNQTFEGK